jgi:hypothetical protein
MTNTYISATDTAKLVRKALKTAFPSIPFRVRKTSGGDINVSWVDGPTDAQVRYEVGHFHGTSFDGMTDSITTIVQQVDGQPTVYSNDVNIPGIRPTRDTQRAAIFLNGDRLVAIEAHKARHLVLRGNISALVDALSLGLAVGHLEIGMAHIIIAGLVTALFAGVEDDYRIHMRVSLIFAFVSTDILSIRHNPKNVQGH